MKMQVIVVTKVKREGKQGGTKDCYCVEFGDVLFLLSDTSTHQQVENSTIKVLCIF